MGGLQAKSMTSQRYRAVTRWRICVTMATLWQQQNGGYALLWKRYDNNDVPTFRWRILHLQQYSHRLNLFLLLRPCNLIFRLPWLMFFRDFSSVVFKCRGITRQDGARFAPFQNFCVVLCMFVLCRSVYCLCVNVCCTTATGWQPKCS